jgi:hypothetical protein
MSSLDRRTFLLAGLAVGTGAAAEPGTDPRPPTLFQQVIPKPTGQNGYEELVAAVDELRTSKLFSQAEELMSGRRLSLSLRRRVVADPPVMRALRLLQQGLAKPVISPRETVTSATVFPDLAGFRQMARLLDIYQYVALADGRVADAIAALRESLRLGQVVQTDTLISGLVGIAIAAIAIRPLSEHLDQLAARDCDLLYQVCLERLSQPALLPQMMEMERRGGKSLLSEISANPKALDGLVSDAPDAGDEDARARQLITDIGGLKGAPEQLAAMLAEAAKRLDEQYQRLLAECRKPAWQRSWPEPPSEGSLAARLVALVAVNPSQVSSRYTIEEARLRLLAIHAAILRYRWEHDQVPVSLAALDLGDLAIDPFTGQPLEYEPLGRKYRLASAGAEGGARLTLVPE